MNNTPLGNHACYHLEQIFWTYYGPTISRMTVPVKRDVYAMEDQATRIRLYLVTHLQNPLINLGIRSTQKYDCERSRHI
jgi:hypothetical protein